MSKIVVESLLRNFKSTSRHPLNKRENNLCFFFCWLGHLGLGTWKPAVLTSRLWPPGLRHSGIGLATSNPDIQSKGSWAQASRHMHLATMDPEVQGIGI